MGEIYQTEQTYDSHSDENLISDQPNQPIATTLQQDISKSEEEIINR